MNFENKPVIPSSRSSADPTRVNDFEAVRLGVNFDKLESYDVYVESQEPERIKEPIESFACIIDSPLNTIMLQHNLAKLGIDRLTAIQKFVLPNVLDGDCDLLVSAPTGSGKSLSYIISIVQGVATLRQNQSLPKGRSPIALIMVPTRELVLQIFYQILPMLQDTGVRALYLYGSKDINEQVEKIKTGVDIVISTPGRLIHLVEMKALQLCNLMYFVVDECDKVLFPQLESNFNRMPVGSKLAMVTDFNQTTIDWILKLFGKSTPELSPANPEVYINKQKLRNMFFSATIDGRIRGEAERFLSPNYVFMIMGDQAKAASTDIKQIVLPCKNYTEKKIELIKLLKNLYIKHDKIMIFVSERIMADTLCDYLNMNGFTTVSIHGNRLQEHREMIIGDFGDGKIPLLVCTYLLGRGINIDNLNCIINFDFPDTISEYIHSIGRTGRMGNIGLAISFFNTTLKQDLNLVKELVQVLRESNQTIPQFLFDIQSKIH